MNATIDIACQQALQLALYDAHTHFTRLAFAYWFVFVFIGVMAGFALAVFTLKKRYRK